MEILLKQNIDYLREEMGYEPYEEEDDDALLYQQGFEADAEEIEDGYFTIPDGYEATIIDDQTYYMKRTDRNGQCYKEIVEELQSGRYQLEGNIIQRIRYSPS